MDNDLDKLFKEVDLIKKDGYIVMIKYDGERIENTITTAIIDPKSEKEAIQYHGEELKILLVKMISAYRRS